ncbi:MAG: hypothetical protein JJ850_16860 [Kordiimonadaceae bacterium]|nr:hypothetical protein [Kordiimonadaceae bacterium]MBO6569762.1 hypothetical protein [Kordiimonadaceae bacterium]MBO6966297.1 hypothetical protein [Kordiimonadaceae bacterium]
MLEVVLIANAIWFGMAFEAFYLRRRIFAKVLVPNRDHRDNTAYAAIEESGKFLGGFNLAISLLNVGLVFNVGGFETPKQWALVLVFNALAHGSQFWGNVPMALQNRKGGGLWRVFKGVMLRIFVIDFTLMVANAVMAVMMLA